jgi:hypothetical protein
MQQQKSMALHSTHSEAIGTLASTQEALHIQSICEFLGVGI